MCNDLDLKLSASRSQVYFNITNKLEELGNDPEANPDEVVSELKAALHKLMSVSHEVYYDCILCNSNRHYM